MVLLLTVSLMDNTGNNIATKCTVNVLKFQTLYAIFFSPKCCFYAFIPPNTCGNANSVVSNPTAPPSGVVWSESVLFAYAILSAKLVYRILEYLP